MKVETLIRRYRSFGYIAIGGDRDQEVDSIIRWLYLNFDIYVYVNYCDIKFKIVPDPYLKFKGAYRFNVGEEKHSQSFFCDIPFTSPLDAKFDALRHLLPGFSFQNKYNSTFRKVK
jgi:hypothetical protein